ncbi:phosphoinositide phospholipase c, ca2+-dependent domain-containing protein [Trichoderma breve]|uniref:Phosphoinositide phospholipase c, ca2+-dependent domain-containing protein n=1 Tax=Trichoderma breve TaxID=2034170 RepID=A0A9W9BIV7_9HYPO|nr:phosphoinositide phospholipase c, ca2+-dependent domain-containing protein [Trichoderma breve]KAJ4860668.1 phosphoinositide phospholipase c, ca2+-dependent domain-containing protein [Trichoderma breve]
MISRHFICVLFALGAVAVPSTSQKVLAGDCSQHGLLWDCGANGLVWTKGAVRMNHMQVVGSHNSYHVEAPKAERDLQTAWTSAATDLQYSHAALDVQLEYLHVRNLELDLLADPEGGMYSDPLLRRFARLGPLDDPKLKKKGTKVLHIPDVDYHTTCSTLVSCLQVIKTWMDAHPDSVPLPIMMEFKTAEELGERLGGAKVVPWDTDLLNLMDEEIRSVFDKSQLITPDDVRRDGLTLEESILKYGWPDLDSARGRIFFLMDNGAPGQGDCAFQRLNDPLTDTDVEFIQAQVRANYWVRTRADEPLRTVFKEKCDISRRDAALRSGAHIVSTDFAGYELSSRWGGGCEGGLEPDEYTEN